MTTNISAIRIITFRRFASVSVFVLLLAGAAGVCSAQIVESVGNRAQGMGGAFVAVASDSSATWWNPAGLATGPFADVAVARGVVDTKDTVPGRRDRVSWFAATAPMVGFSYYRLRITDIQRSGAKGQPLVDREDTRAGVSVRSFSVNELGLTVVQSVLPGVHAGATLKYVRGISRGAAGDAARPPSELLDAGEELGGGSAENRFDLDAGVIGVAGAIRVGAVMRNIRALKFGDGAFTLPRQTRVGVALDIEKAGGPPLTLAVDADARAYATASGERRVVAAGAEQWLWMRRLGIRGGGRFNTVGARERVATAGVSVLVRTGMYVEAQVARGGAPFDSGSGSDERRRGTECGWGVGARVAF
jgi:hypothetical protein